ncbi:winged helix-turn-helix transcriptional regulator [Caminibacter pacificus]
MFYKSGAISSQIYLSDRQKDIIDLIKQNPKIGYRKIAEILDINPSAVLKHLEKLKKLGVIERIGGTRGYWKVNI